MADAELVRYMTPPAARAGNSRVFSDAQVQRIGSELQRIASDKRGGV